MEYVMYILVNKDLEMSKGKTSAQVAHTVVNFMLDRHMFPFNEWKASGQKKIVLQAPQKLMEELEATGKYYPVRDKGLTEIAPNSLTAICLGVNTKDRFYEELPKLKRLRLL